MPTSFGWLDVHRIAEGLADSHPERDPFSVRFVDLRAMVERLPGFVPDPAHPVNEKILETIQMAWHDERDGVVDEDEE